MPFLVAARNELAGVFIVSAVAKMADRGQIEGGIVDGLGAAFFGSVPIERGRATVANFDDYRLIRQREAPAAIAV